MGLIRTLIEIYNKKKKPQENISEEKREKFQVSYQLLEYISAEIIELMMKLEEVGKVRKKDNISIVSIGDDGPMILGPIDFKNEVFEFGPGPCTCGKKEEHEPLCKYYQSQFTCGKYIVRWTRWVKPDFITAIDPYPFPPEVEWREVFDKCRASV